MKERIKKIFLKAFGYMGVVDTQIRSYNRLKKAMPGRSENEILNRLIFSRIRALPRIAPEEEELAHYGPLIDNPNKTLEDVIWEIIFFENLKSRTNILLKKKIPPEVIETWILEARQYIKERTSKIKPRKSMESTWEQDVNNMFNSKSTTELELRAFCTYFTLKARIYTEVLSDVLEILNSEGLDVERGIWIAVFGKLTGATICVMDRTVLQHFKSKQDDVNSFVAHVFNTFLWDFGERKETLLGYMIANDPSLGDGQVVWPLGSQICEVVGREDASLAMKITTFREQIAKIGAETTLDILGAPFDELKEKMLKLNYATPTQIPR